jgi:hypothetical protein
MQKHAESGQLQIKDWESEDKAVAKRRWPECSKGSRGFAMNKRPSPESRKQPSGPKQGGSTMTEKE